MHQRCGGILAAVALLLTLLLAGVWAKPAAASGKAEVVPTAAVHHTKHKRHHHKKQRHLTVAQTRVLNRVAKQYDEDTSFLSHLSATNGDLDMAGLQLDATKLLRQRWPSWIQAPVHALADRLQMTANHIHNGVPLSLVTRKLLVRDSNTILRAFKAHGGHVVRWARIIPAVKAPQTTSTTTAPTTTTAPSTTTTTTPPKPTIIATFSGSGIENTPAFATPAIWRLSWYYNCSNFGMSGNFIVDEYNTNGNLDFNGVSVDELGTGRGPVATYAYGDAGSHYLSIDSECDWQVVVVSGGGS